MFLYINRSVWCEIQGSHSGVPEDPSLLCHWVSSFDISKALWSFGMLVITYQLTWWTSKKVWILWNVWNFIVFMHGSQTNLAWRIHYFISTFYHSHLFMAALFNSRLVQYSSSVPLNCAHQSWKSLSSMWRGMNWQRKAWKYEKLC
jgi:hypothetical protein